MPAILQVRKLRKQFKTLEAVKGISFDIEQGVCFGLLGPNGAGKTTTIEMIEGITPPTEGEIFYKGVLNNPQFKPEAGIQFQSTALMDYLSVHEVLKLFSGLYNNAVPLESLIRQCHLQDFLKQRASKLSGGQKQRLLLALALINDPEIVFLDEPTTGLDPQSRRNFWRLIQSIKDRGKTIVLTTHYMDEAEYLCDHLLIVDKGKIVTEGSPQDLLNEHFGFAYVCLPENALEEKELQQFDHRQQHGKLEIISHSIETTLRDLLSFDVDLADLQVRNPTLDDLFLKITGHSLRE